MVKPFNKKINPAPISENAELIPDKRNPSCLDAELAEAGFLFLVLDFLRVDATESLT